MSVNFVHSRSFQQKDQVLRTNDLRVGLSQLTPLQDLIQGKPSKSLQTRNITYPYQEPKLPKLHEAILQGGSDVCSLICTEDVNELDCFGRTPLFCSICAKNSEVFFLLLESSVDIHRSEGGYSPLHVAAEIDRDCSFLLPLIHKGAQVNRLAYPNDSSDWDDAPKTPLDLALEHKNFTAAIELIREKGKIHHVKRDQFVSFRTVLLNSNQITLGQVDYSGEPLDS